jgi:hypothetical protein
MASKRRRSSWPSSGRIVGKRRQASPVSELTEIVMRRRRCSAPRDEITGHAACVGAASMSRLRARSRLVLGVSCLLGCGARTEGLCAFGACEDLPYSPTDDAGAPPGGESDATLPECPVAVPALDSACRYEALSCRWPDACGGDIAAVCRGRTWHVTLHACGPCPVLTPVSRTRCSEPSSCTYTVVFDKGEIPPCRTDCLCRVDGRWSCGAAVCS